MTNDRVEETLDHICSFVIRMDSGIYSSLGELFDDCHDCVSPSDVDSRTMSSIDILASIDPEPEST